MICKNKTRSCRSSLHHETGSHWVNVKDDLYTALRANENEKGETIRLYALCSLSAKMASGYENLHLILSCPVKVRFHIGCAAVVTAEIEHMESMTASRVRRMNQPKER